MASSTIEVAELSKRLQCAVCLETMCNPKNLSCSHSYCKHCLNKLLKFSPNGSASIKCPQGCETVTKISSKETTNDLGTNYMLQDIIEMTNVEGKDTESKVQCEEETCNRDARRYCTHCQIFRCDHCPDRHNTEDSLVPVGFCRGQNRLVILCEEHSTEATYVCCEKTFVCIYCVNRDHKLHEYVTLGNMEKSLKAAVTEKLNKNDLDKQQRELQKDIMEIKQSLQKALKANKLKCMSDYCAFLDKEEATIKEAFSSLSTKHSTEVDPVAYLRECLTKEGSHFVLRGTEIVSKLEDIDEGDILPDFTLDVSLTDPKYNGEHPLGALSTLRHRYFKKEDRKCFKSKIAATGVSPSISSLQSLLRDSLETFPERSTADVDRGKNKCSGTLVTTFTQSKTIENGHQANIFISFQVKNVSKVKYFVVSDPAKIRELSWRISLSSMHQPGNATVSVRCRHEEKDSSRACEAKITIILRNRKGIHLMRTLSHTFHSNDGGHASSIPWDELTDMNKCCGDDAVTIETFIEAKDLRMTPLEESSKRKRCSDQ